MKEPTPLKKNVIVLIMILGTFVTALNQTIMSVATPTLMDDLKITASTAQWLTSGYLLVNGVIIPITAFFMKRFTTRQLFLSSMIFFLIGTSIAAIAINFPTVLVGRLIQAVGAGIIIPLLYNVVLKLYPPSKRGTVMGMISLAILFAPAIGPTLAGYVLDYYPWQAMFYSLIPIIILIIISGFIYLKNVSETSKAKVDILSVILSTVAFSGILYGFSLAGNEGWSDIIVIMSLVIGFITLGSFVHRQLTSSEPMLDLRTFKYGTFGLLNLINIGITIIMYADMILLPLYLQSTRGFTAMEAGLLMLPGAVMMGALSPVSGKLYDRFGAKWITIIGVAITIGTTIPFSLLTDTTAYSFLMLMSTGRRVGIALLITPIQTAGLNQVPTSLSSHASAIWNTIRQIAGALGTSLLVTVMTISATKNVDRLTSSNIENTKDAMTEATIQGINDAYLVIVIIAIVCLLLSFFIRSDKHIRSDKG